MELLQENNQFSQITQIKRPQTAALSRDSSKQTLGSACPVIIKHDFPNEQKNYIDNVGQEMSSSKKRFIYDRPYTAKIQKRAWGGSNGAQDNTQPAQAGKRISMSAGGQHHPHQLNSADLYNKLLEGQKIKKESRFVIKPARKLNTFSIHSALFKIKKQKEELDGKIRELEDLKTNFNEMDFYLIANSGAVDYMFNGPVNPNGKHNDFLSNTDDSNYFQESQNQIISLKNLHLPSSLTQKNVAALAKQNQLEDQNKLTKSTSIKGAETTALQGKTSNKEERPKTSLPKSGKKKDNSKLRPQTAKANSRDEISMLRGDSRDISHDQQNPELEILGNCAKVFQQNERSKVHHWGDNIDKQDGVKETIDQLGQNLSTINRLLSGKSLKQQPNGQDFHNIQEEADDEIEDLKIQSFETLLKNQPSDTKNINNIQSSQQYPTISTNTPFFSPQNQQSQKFQQTQFSGSYGLQSHQYQSSLQYSMTQDIQQQLAQSYQQQQQDPQLQSSDMPTVISGMYPTFQKKQSIKGNMKRVQSATTQQGVFRPLSGNQLSATQQARPMTAAGDGLSYNKTSYHALLSYGPVQVVKERITRNYDHLELLAAAQEQEKRKKLKDKLRQESQFDKLNLKISGQRLAYNSENLVDLVKQTQEALQRFNASSSASAGVNPPAFFSSDNQSQILQQASEFSLHQQKQLQQLQQRILSQGDWQNNQNHNLSLNQQDQIQEITRLQQLHSHYNMSAISAEQSLLASNRAAIDLDQMQKDQSLKLIRPGTAKNPSLRPSSAVAAYPFNGLNVPFAESVAFKLQSEASNGQYSNPTNSLLMVSGQGASLAQLHSHDLHQLGSHANAAGISQSGAVLHQQQQLLAAAQNFHNIQSMQMVQSIEAQMDPRFQSVVSQTDKKETENVYADMHIKTITAEADSMNYSNNNESNVPNYNNNNNNMFSNENASNMNQLQEEDVTQKRGKMVRPQTAAIKR